MPNKYYTLPLNLKAIRKGKQHALCSLAESIQQNIALLLNTHYGENRFDKEFGCSIWEQEFQNIPLSTNQWYQKMDRELPQIIREQEKRLCDVVVKTNIPISKIRHLKQVRKFIEVHITATIKKTDEPFQHIQKLYFNRIFMEEIYDRNSRY